MKKLRYLHYKFSSKRDVRDAAFPIQKGIFGLTEFTLMTSIEILISMTNIIIVLFFIFNSNSLIGGIVSFMVLILLLVVFPVIVKLGSISKEKEELKNYCLSLFNSNKNIEYLNTLEEIQVKEKKRFWYDTILVFCNFFIFKLTPTFIIFYYIYNDSNKYGELASMFLYFAILYGPISNLIKIVKQSTQFFSQATIFKDDIERAIKIESKLNSIPFGLVCIERKNDNIELDFLNQLKEKSRSKIEYFFCDKKNLMIKADFVITKDLELMTAPKFICEDK